MALKQKEKKKEEEEETQCAEMWQVPGRGRGSGWGARAGLRSFYLQVGPEHVGGDPWAEGGGSPCSCAAQVRCGQCLHPSCHHHLRGVCQGPLDVAWPPQCPFPSGGLSGTNHSSTLLTKSHSAPLLVDHCSWKEKSFNKYRGGSSFCGAAEMNPTRNHEVVGLIPGLTQWVVP